MYYENFLEIENLTDNGIKERELRMNKHAQAAILTVGYLVAVGIVFNQMEEDSAKEAHFNHFGTLTDPHTGELDLQDALIDSLSETTSLSHEFEEAVDGIQPGENRRLSHDGKQYQISLVPQ